MLAVILPTFRRPEALARALAALRGQSAPAGSFRVTVVNDGSHGAAYARAAGGLPEDWSYLALPRRRGAAAARNAGAAASRGRYLVFTDDDCLPPPQWLERLLEAVSRPGAPAVLSGPVEPLPARRRRAMRRYLQATGFLQPRVEEGRLVCLAGANLAVRRDWFERVGGFSERFPDAGGEDLDLTFRLREAGADWEILPRWVNRHPMDLGLREFLRRRFRYGRGGELHARLRREGFPEEAERHDSLPAWLRRTRAALAARVEDARLEASAAGQAPARAGASPGRAGLFLLALAGGLCYKAGTLCARAGAAGAVAARRIGFSRSRRARKDRAL